MVSTRGLTNAFGWGAGLGARLNLNGVPVCLFRLSEMLASAEQRGEFGVVNVTSDTQNRRTCSKAILSILTPARLSL